MPNILFLYDTPPPTVVKNRRVFSKVEDTENGVRNDSLPEEKNMSFFTHSFIVVLPVKKTEKSGREEIAFTQTRKHCFLLIRFHLLPMLKHFHGSLSARHAVIVKSFCYSRSSNLVQNLLPRKWITYFKQIGMSPASNRFPRLDWILYISFLASLSFFLFPICQCDTTASWDSFQYPYIYSDIKLDSRCSCASRKTKSESNPTYSKLFIIS